MEATFLKRNFLLLTGVVIDRSKMNSEDYFELCTTSRLSPADFDMISTTTLKLSVLEGLMNIQINAKMIGDYASTNPMLYTEKLAGNVKGCLGFINDNGKYYPNTALKEDIRNISLTSCARVLLVFKKRITDTVYTELCYTAKKIDPQKVALPDTLNIILNE